MTATQTYPNRCEHCGIPLIAEEKHRCRFAPKKSSQLDRIEQKLDQLIAALPPTNLAKSVLKRQPCGCIMPDGRSCGVVHTTGVNSLIPITHEEH